jgi:flagellar motor switch protein FliG
MSDATLRGAEKAAALLMSIGSEAAARVLRSMPGEVVDKVTAELMKTTEIDPGVREAVVEEATNEVGRSMGLLPGGEEYAFSLLASIYGENSAREMIERIHRTQQPLPFSFLRKLDPAQIRELIEVEQPQTIALVMGYLEPRLAAKILTELPSATKLEIATRLATIEPTAQEAIAAAERGLIRRVEGMASGSTRAVGGVKPIAAVLNQVDRSSEREIIEGLANHDPAIADAVRRLMFTFDDLVLIDDRGMQKVIGEIGTDLNKIAIAMRGASETVRKRFFDNMSSRTAGDLTELLAAMGPTRRKTIDEAQQEIVEIIRRLEEAEEIVINRGGDSDAVI